MFRMLKFLDPEVVTARSHAWLYLALLKPRLWWQCDCFQVPMSSHVVPGPFIWFVHVFLGLFLHACCILLPSFLHCCSASHVQAVSRCIQQCKIKCSLPKGVDTQDPEQAFTATQDSRQCDQSNAAHLKIRKIWPISGSNVYALCIFLQKGRTWATVQIASQGSFCTNKRSWNHLFVFAFTL